MTFCVENEIEADFPFDMEAMAEALKICLESDVLPTEEQLIEMIKEQK